MDVRDARASFPGLEGKVFLDAATVSLAPVQARDAIAGFLERAVLCPERDASTHHIAMDELRGGAVREAAALLGAGEDEIALVESTSHGLSIAARALGLGPRDNVVTDDLEFLQVAIPWFKLVEEGSLGEVRRRAERRRRGHRRVDRGAGGRAHARGRRQLRPVVERLPARPGGAVGALPARGDLPRRRRGAGARRAADGRAADAGRPARRRRPQVAERAVRLRHPLRPPRDPGAARGSRPGGTSGSSRRTAAGPRTSRRRRSARCARTSSWRRRSGSS